MAFVKPAIDYYAVLEVSQMDSLVSIKASYHRLALLKHPDKAKDNDNATADFQRLEEAYSTLSDPELRKNYDLSYNGIQRTQQSEHIPKNKSKKPEGPSSGAKNDRSQEQNEDSRKDELAERLRVLKLEKEFCKRKIAQTDRSAHQLRFDAKFLQEEATKTEKQKTELELQESANKSAQKVNKQNLDNNASDVQGLRQNLTDLDAEIERISREMPSKQSKESKGDKKEGKGGVACDHSYRWPCLQGHYSCSLCEKTTRKFAFLCPGCEKIACAPCREVLKFAASS